MSRGILIVSPEERPHCPLCGRPLLEDFSIKGGEATLFVVRVDDDSPVHQGDCREHGFWEYQFEDDEEE